MKTTKFDCPFCEQPVELPTDDTRQEIHCPSCSRIFNPAVFEGPIPNEQKEKHTVEERVVEFPARDRAGEIAAIRQQAGIATFGAVLLATIGAIFLLIALRACVALEAFDSDLVVGGCLCGAAIWIYLIAQVIHIRANTHK